MLAALRSRQEALEEALQQRLEELRKLCLREAVSGASAAQGAGAVCLHVSPHGHSERARGRSGRTCHHASRASGRL